MQTEPTLEQRARRRVARKMGFYIHLLVFVVVNGALWLLNATLGQPRWAMWPTLGWGIGLAVHAIVTFARLHGEGLHDRLVAQEVERLRARAGR